MAYDLLRACSEVSEGRQSAPDLLGQHWVRPLKVEHAWYMPLTSRTLTLSHTLSLQGGACCICCGLPQTHGLLPPPTDF